LEAAAGGAGVMARRRRQPNALPLTEVATARERRGGRPAPPAEWAGLREPTRYLNLSVTDLRMQRKQLASLAAESSSIELLPGASTERGGPRGHLLDTLALLDALIDASRVHSFNHLVEVTVRLYRGDSVAVDYATAERLRRAEQEARP